MFIIATTIQGSTIAENGNKSSVQALPSKKSSLEPSFMATLRISMVKMRQMIGVSI